MNCGTILFAILSFLASATDAGPVRRSQTLATRDFIPEHIIWQNNVNRTQNPMVPKIGAVKACQRITYYSGTPATGIRRSDCQKLANQVRSDNGYVSIFLYLSHFCTLKLVADLLGLEWEMWWWNSASGCKTLASYGTCNVAISRFDGEASYHQHASDVAM